MTGLDQVKQWHESGGDSAFRAALELPTQDNKETRCPMCDKKKFKLKPRGLPSAYYVCTCSAGVKGFSFIDLFIRHPLGMGRGPQHIASDADLLEAARRIDGLFAIGAFEGAKPETPAERQARERLNAALKAEREEAEARDDAEHIAQSRATAQNIAQGVIDGECAYMKRKGLLNKTRVFTADVYHPDSVDLWAQAGDGAIPYYDYDEHGEPCLRYWQCLPSNPKRAKSMTRHAATRGAFAVAACPPEWESIIICEGWATAVSVALAMPECFVVAAVSCYNLAAVADAMAERWPGIPLIFAADNDYKDPQKAESYHNGELKENAGVKYAKAAAAVVGGIVIYPQPLDGKKTDFDDYRRAVGVSAMREFIRTQLQRAKQKTPAGMPDAPERPATVPVTQPPPGGMAALNYPKLDVIPYCVETGSGKTAIVPETYNYTFGVSHIYRRYYPDDGPEITHALNEPYVCQHQRGPLVIWILHHPVTDRKATAIKANNPVVLCRGLSVTGVGELDGVAYITLQNDATGQRWTLALSAVYANLRTALITVTGFAPSDREAIGFIALMIDHLAARAPRLTYSTQSGWQQNAAGRVYLSASGETWGRHDDDFQLIETSTLRGIFTTAGTLEGWQQTVAGPARGNHSVMWMIGIAINAGFYPFRDSDAVSDKATHIAHFYAESTGGKTSAMKAAASVWGRPDAGNFDSWNATAHGLPHKGRRHHHGVMFLDELQNFAMGKTAGIRAKTLGTELSAMLMILQNGSIRTTATPINDGVNVRAFRSLVISNGERSLEQQIIEWGGSAAGGLQARMLDYPFLPLQALNGIPPGLTDETRFAALAENIEAAAMQHYGHVARAVMEMIATDPACLSEYRREAAAFLAWIHEQYPDRDRVLSRAIELHTTTFAALAVTRHLTGWTLEGIVEAAAQQLQAWIENRGSGSRSESLFINRLVYSLLAGGSYPHHLSAIQEQKRYYNGYRIGAEDEMGRDITPKPGDVYAVTSETLKTLSEGMTRKQRLNALTAAGMLTKDDAGKDIATIQHITVGRDNAGGRRYSHNVLKIILPDADTIARAMEAAQ
ncbi:DNA primase TraC [Buttiauxella agrestis]|uniref:DNA primase TraC n=1 Tax=Buttiauxella agrestis TaxID=82977 RepID=A0A381KP22_9ENTR|nr:DUF927 domain-containing protein [Buttiauxella agrestis]SUY93059.1 DNA primase TraC [Buttiauxella agrestis]